MKRFILALGLFFAGVLNAMAANAYIDNRIIATGTAQAAGTTTTLVTATLTPTAPFVVADTLNASLIITSGTNAPAITKPFKITAIDVTDPLLPIFTVHQTFNGANTPQADWTFTVTYGCNANTTFNTPTKASSLTGPKLTIYNTATAASSGDTIYIKGGTGSNYTGANDAVNTNVYLNTNSKSLNFEGYLSTPGDLNLAAGVIATDANSTNFPVIMSTGSSRTIDIDAAVTSATAYTFRNLVITNTSASAVGCRNQGPGASTAFTECVLLTSAVGASASTYSEQTTSGVTKSITFTDCTLYTENTWYVGSVCKELTFTNCAFNATIASTSNHAIQLAGTQGSATVHPLKITFDSCAFSFNGSGSSAKMISTTGLTNTNPFTVKNCTATYNGTGSMLAIKDGISNFDFEGNTFTNTASGGSASTLLSIGVDTAVPQFGCGQVATVLHSAAASAAGTGNLVSGQSTFVLSSTGSPSATDDFYIDRFIRFPALTGVYPDRITDYVGGTRTVTVWGTFQGSATAPAYEIVKYDRVASSVVVKNNTLKFTGTRSHVLLFGQGCDGAIADGNYFLEGDWAIVIKAEDCLIQNNCVSGDQAIILKGASRNKVFHNTFYSDAVGAAGACFEFSDKSPVVENLHGVVYSKCYGNIIMNNIIAVKSDVSNRCMFEYDIGDGSWSEDSDDGPLRQNNLIDYNVYVMGNGANFGYVDSAAVATFTAWKTKMANIEADGLPYCKMFPLNDAHSTLGTITFRDPTNGDFTVIGGTAARTMGSDGLLIGVNRTATGRNPFIFAN